MSKIFPACGSMAKPRRPRKLYVSLLRTRIQKSGATSSNKPGPEGGPSVVQFHARRPGVHRTEWRARDRLRPGDLVGVDLAPWAGSPSLGLRYFDERIDSVQSGLAQGPLSATWRMVHRAATSCSAVPVMPRPARHAGDDGDGRLRRRRPPRAYEDRWKPPWPWTRSRAAPLIAVRPPLNDEKSRAGSHCRLFCCDAAVAMPTQERRCARR